MSGVYDRNISCLKTNQYNRKTKWVVCMREIYHDWRLINITQAAGQVMIVNLQSTVIYFFYILHKFGFLYIIQLAQYKLKKCAFKRYIIEV